MIVCIGLLALACVLVFFLTDIPRCARCDTVWGVEHRRMSTQYHDEESNWTDQCPTCFEKTEEYWHEMWADYWASVL